MVDQTKYLVLSPFIIHFFIIHFFGLCDFCRFSLKASALVRIVCLACPSIKPGVELLGKALQLAERDKMADHAEHVRERGTQSAK